MHSMHGMMCTYICVCLSCILYIYMVTIYAHSTVFCMQMISLYKDPTGKNVFPEPRPSNNTDVKRLQERVVQLEKLLTEVC